MMMNAPSGSAGSTLIDESLPRRSSRFAPAQRRERSGYLRELARRREGQAIRQQTGYGLIVGWIVTLVAGFLFFCVPSRFDLLWGALIVVGLIHLVLAVFVPQALAWPQRLWMAIARWQGWLVMTILLTVVYYSLIWPAAQFSKQRTRGFVAWDSERPAFSVGWSPIEVSEIDQSSVESTRHRSLPVLLASVVGFFFRRGDYVLLPILILLLVLGLVLYFVQSSAVAPFIYTLF